MLEQMDETDVVIVGAGPSGLALAVALAHYGIKVRNTIVFGIQLF